MPFLLIILVRLAGKLAEPDQTAISFAGSFNVAENQQSDTNPKPSHAEKVVQRKIREILKHEERAEFDGCESGPNYLVLSADLVQTGFQLVSQEDQPNKLSAHADLTDAGDYDFTHIIDMQTTV
jgi:hypothetical protein